jgi:hypothetical protein
MFAGLAEPTVARYRLLGTAIGAALAIAAHIQFRLRTSRHLETVEPRPA